MFNRLRGARGNLLVDTYGRPHTYLRVSVTERCNFRCQYCMPPEGVALTPSSALLTTEEFKTVIRTFSEMGITKVRFTGGEPLIHKDIAELIHFTRHECRVEEVGLTTNGALLVRHFAQLVEAGLTSVNISIDSLQNNRFQEVTRVNGLATVQRAIERAKEEMYKTNLGFKVKLNCVVMRDFNVDELVHFALLTKDDPIEVRFIEYMPFCGNQWEREKVFSFMESMDVIEKGLGQKLLPAMEGGTQGAVAKLFRVPGFKGRIGFISTVTMPFCSSCNRLRLTADGKLLNCLFDQTEMNLFPVLRNENGSCGGKLLKECIQDAVRKKKQGFESYSNDNSLSTQTRPMIKIGG